MPYRVAVKICGVTDAADALLSAELGADFLGLNFWPGSPRHVGLERARKLAAVVRAAAPRVALVGVFVNPDAGFVEEVAAAVGLDLLQVSGDEPAAAVRPEPDARRRPSPPTPASRRPASRTTAAPAGSGTAALRPRSLAASKAPPAPSGTPQAAAASSWPAASGRRTCGRWSRRSGRS